MRAKSKNTPRSSRKRKSQYDELPELTDEMLRRAVIRKAGKTIGRPRLANPKVAISLRVDADALRRWKAKGPGWQTRMAEVLKSAV
jgi:uncharacterized protein (DUF4415 family)